MGKAIEKIPNSQTSFVASKPGGEKEGGEKAKGRGNGVGVVLSESEGLRRTPRKHVRIQ